MSETPLVPVVVLHVPAGHDTDPQALDALVQHATTQYGASILVNPRLHATPAPRPILLGNWGATPPAQVLADLDPLIARVFFNLDWLFDVI